VKEAKEENREERERELNGVLKKVSRNKESGSKENQRNV